MSTLWNAGRSAGQAPAVEELVRLGHRAVALDGRLDAADVATAAGVARAARAHVTCVFAQSPGDDADPGSVSGLSSLRGEVGERAVRNSLAAIDAAAQLSCGVAVLRAGSVPALDPGREARWHEQMLQEGQTATLHAEVRAAIDADRAERDRMLGALCERLHALLSARPDTNLLIETSSSALGLPHPAEARHLLDEFRGKSLGYWHDAGHAAHLFALGVCRQEEWLEQLGPRTGGVTLCDWSPLGGRLPPNAGLVGWKDLRFQLRSDWPRVLALDPSFPAPLVDDTLRELTDLGF